MASNITFNYTCFPPYVSAYIDSFNKCCYNRCLENPKGFMDYYCFEHRGEEEKSLIQLKNKNKKNKNYHISNMFCGDTIKGTTIPHGNGMIFNQSKLRYSGEFINGKKHGFGNEFNSNGEIIYKGQFRNNKRHGYGNEFKSNYEYEGQWVNNMKNGEGCLYKINKQKQKQIYYCGEWNENVFHGFGVLYYKNQQVKYMGKFQLGDVIESGW